VVRQRKLGFGKIEALIGPTDRGTAGVIILITRRLAPSEPCCRKRQA
jgi:hypothetical protein